jgi:hypothetical protein
MTKGIKTVTLKHKSATRPHRPIQVSTYVDESEYETLVSSARALDLPLSAFVRRVLMRSAAATVEAES